MTDPPWWMRHVPALGAYLTPTQRQAAYHALELAEADRKAQQAAHGEQVAATVAGAWEHHDNPDRTWLWTPSTGVRPVRVVEVGEALKETA